MRFTDAPARALAVFAHPDDPEVACAGALAAWVDRGAEVWILIVNAGDKGHGEPVGLVDQRQAEVDAAAAVLGIAGTVSFGIPDGTVENDEALRERLVTEIRARRPDVVVAPDPTAVFFGDTYVNHHDHRAVGWAVLDACAPMAGSPLYYPDAGPAHAVGTLLLAGTLEPDCWVDISGTVDRKAAALACHTSQLAGHAELVGEVVQARAEEAAQAAADAGTSGLTFAEGFRRLRLA